LATAIWSDGTFAAGDGSTPAYFRKKFFLSVEPILCLLDVKADDDCMVYLNGILVHDDQDGTAAPTYYDIDVTTALQAGENLIAVKAHDSFGINENFSADLEVQYAPEPATLGLLALGGLAVMRRRR
jgi:hypothetical protein